MTNLVDTDVCYCQLIIKKNKVGFSSMINSILIFFYIGYLGFFFFGLGCLLGFIVL